MARRGEYPREVRERAARMGLEQRGEYETQWAAICSIAEKFGMIGETLQGWVRQAEIDAAGGWERRPPRPLRSRSCSVRGANCDGPTRFSRRHRLSLRGSSTRACRNAERVRP